MKDETYNKPADFIEEKDVLGLPINKKDNSEIIEEEPQIAPQLDSLEISTDNPKIYSKKAIWFFSVLFSPIFGGVLLMQNLKDIGNKKAANIVLFSSIIFTIIAILIVDSIETKTSSLTYLINMGFGAILSEYFFKKYFPLPDNYEKKKIWKPLIISFLITIPFILALIHTNAKP